MQKLVDSFDASFSYVASEGSTFYFRTNLRAPRYKCALCLLCVLPRLLLRLRLLLLPGSEGRKQLAAVAGVKGRE